MASDHLIELMVLAERLIGRDTASDGGSVRDHAAEMGLPLSTAHRHVAALVGAGLMQRTARGRYFPGPRLLALSSTTKLHRTMTELARPFLRELTAIFQCTAHLGVLENEMVSYLVKEGAGQQVFSREGLQLEAYCSALGKVLLSALPRDKLDSYLAEDEFVALTPFTKVRPGDIATELAYVIDHGYALDLQESSEGLNCLALPVHGPGGQVCAAISVSRFGWELDGPMQAQILEEMRPRVRTLSLQLGASAAS